MLILELRLQAVRLDALRTFYGETLGLPILEFTSDLLIIQAGSTKLTFDRHGSAGRYHIAFDVPENQAEEAAAWIESRTNLVALNGKTRFDFPNWNAHSVYFYDPAGNILELIARHNQSNASDQPFEASSILAVSEIGLAADDVEATVAELCGILGAGIYDGAGSDTFTAVGDENGLCIIVKRGRMWYPETGILAKIQPVHLTVAGDQTATFGLPGTSYQISLKPSL